MPFTAKKLLTVIFLSALLVGPAVAAKTLTLDDCVDLALKNHPDAISARGNVSVAGGNLWNAFGNFLPYVSASGQVSQTTGSIVVDGVVISPNRTTKNYSLGASAQLTVFNGGRNIFNYLEARASKARYEYLKEQSEQGLILMVKTYYFNYLASRRILEVREEAVKRGEEQLKLAESKYEVGSASKSDVLKAKVQYGNDRLALIDAENGVKKAYADLSYYIGIDVNSDNDFATEYSTREYKGNEADALNFGMTNHPGFLASEKNMAAAKNGLWSAYGQFLPTVSVYYSRNYQNEFWHQVNDLSFADRRWSISTSVNFPIFTNFSRKAAVSSAKVSLNNARASYYYSKNYVAREIKKAFLDMNKAKEKLNVVIENEAAAGEDMSLVQEKYNLGAATILELLDAQVSLITAQYDKIQAEFDYNLAIATLDNAMGTK